MILRDVLKCVYLVDGVQSVMTYGMDLMLEQFADNLAIPSEVCSQKSYKWFVVYDHHFQVLKHTILLTLDKALVQLTWTMFSVREMSHFWSIAHLQQITTVSISRMLELFVLMQVVQKVLLGLLEAAATTMKAELRSVLLEVGEQSAMTHGTHQMLRLLAGHLDYHHQVSKCI